MDADVNGGKKEVRFAFRVNDALNPRSVVSAAIDNGMVTVGDTSTPAAVGDFFRPTTGALAFQEIPIVAVSTNSFVIATTALPAASDNFFIMRYATQRVDEGGSQLIVASSGPVQFVLDAVDTEVEEDTGTPANSKPLPVKVLKASGLDGDLATETTLVDVATNTDVVASTVATPGTGIGTDGVTILGSDGTNFQNLKTDVNGELQIDVLSSALPSGASTSAKQDSEIALLTTIDADTSSMAADLSVIAGIIEPDGSAIGTDAIPIMGSDGSFFRVLSTDSSGGLMVNVMSSPLPSGAASEATLLANGVLIGAVNETAPASDIASSGLNGRLQRIAQRLTSLIALFPASIGQKNKAGSFSVALASDDDSLALLGPVNETAPATDIASSGLNGRLQRIAQRLTSLIALLPASLGQKTMANSLAVTMASDQGALSTKAPVNTNGQCDNTSLTATTASTATAPANAVGFILEAPSDNTHNIRYRIGGTASTTAGMLMEPGRDSGYIPCAANVSVCATTSGTNVFSIQWIMSA